MLVNQFDFDLPEELIARYPAVPRDSARLLYISGKNFGDNMVTDLPSFLNKNDVLVFNNTRVIPARLKGKRKLANIEVTLHKPINYAQSIVWKAFAKPAKRLRIGDIIKFADDFSAEVMEKGKDGEVTLIFDISQDKFSDMLTKYGEIPLPPYIISRRKLDKNDHVSYQTIFAEVEGAIAAPTAGLHFTEELFGRLDKIGVKKAFVTLHVGAGTFLPVKAEDTKDHKMHSEYCYISTETAGIINKAKSEGGRIIAIGTTSLRTLETATDDNGHIKEYSGETNIFITPGYKFKAVDILFTNFHLPRSTLFMLVCAFAGTDNMLAAYQHAIKNRYRFYSYGDACLLQKGES